MPRNLPFKKINEFSFRQLLHEGPYTLVYLGFQDNLQRDVLIKLLKPGSSSELKKRFEREARVYARLNHPNIVSVHALGEKEGWLYIILEYISGINLRQLMDKQRIESGWTWYITDTILQALEHASGQGVVHRDLKPENILIDLQGRVKVADFGLARINDEPSVTQQQSLVGTPAYMSPEQITGDAITVQSDLFSLCTVIYEMLFGKKAFGGEGYAESINKILNDNPPLPQQKTAGLSDEWYNFLEKGLRKQRSKRWLTADDARMEWQALLLHNSNAQKEISTAVGGLVTVDTGRSAGKQQPGTDSKVRFKNILYIILLMLLGLVIYSLWEMPLQKSEISDDVPADTLIHFDSLKAGTKSAASSAPQDTSRKVQKNQPHNKSQTAQKPSVSPAETDTAVTEQKINPAELELNITPWAKVTLDQTVLDTHLVNGKFSLPQGIYSLRLEHPRFNPEIKKITLLPGKRAQVNWSFWTQTGFLKLEVRPWAHVYINDEFFDTTPLPEPLRIPAGNKILELRHPSFKNHRERILISAGDTLSMKITLQP